ncbi:MAG: sulfotransferase [Candidatus Omnitrophica bacterium]|nr:sulfotransferase [Candidatus Omnitrophota bacterium]
MDINLYKAKRFRKDFFPPFFWGWENKPKRREKLIIIGGLQRSGNHLLRGLLDGHPQLIVPPEEDYFVRTLARSHVEQIKGCLLKSSDAPGFYKKMQKDGHFERVNEGKNENSANRKPLFDLDQYYQYVQRHYKKYSLQRLIQTHFEALSHTIIDQQVHPLKTKVMFCSFNPLHYDVLNVGRMLSQYYDLKAVFIFRHPLGTYCSGRKRQEFDNIDLYCRQVNDHYEDVLKFSEENLGEVFCISFEKLIKNIEPNMRDVAHFLDIKFDHILNEYTQNREPTISNSSYERKKGVDPSVIDRYKDMLTEEEISLIELRCGDKFDFKNKVLNYSGTTLEQADNDLNESIASFYYGELSIPDRRQFEVFKQYMHYYHYVVHMPKLENILEIGAGYSTVLIGQLAELRKCNVYSIDVNADNLFKKIEHTRFYRNVKDNITFIERSSISKKVFNLIYDAPYLTDIGGVMPDQIKNQLHRFILCDKGYDLRKFDNICRSISNENESQLNLVEQFIHDGKIFLPKKIIEQYIEPDDEFDFFKKLKDEDGVVETFYKEQRTFDVVFFDSGEFSSIPEWTILKKLIRPGGIAVFHDIYFPKSFKNFLVCATVCADKEWDIVYQDYSTPQGLLIARKK